MQVGAPVTAKVKRMVFVTLASSAKYTAYQMENVHVFQCRVKFLIATFMLVLIKKSSAAELYCVYISYVCA